MTPEEIKHILDTSVADKMKPVIKEILEMDGGGRMPEITDPILLAKAAESRKARAELSPVTSQAEVMEQQARNDLSAGKTPHPNVLAYLAKFKKPG